MNLLRFSAVLIAGSLLFGCASPAQVENMKIDDSVNMTFDEKLTNAIAVNQVDGGEETNPLWTSEIGNAEFESALKHSLQLLTLIAKDGQPEYELSAQLMEVDQPSFGLDMEVTSSIRYVLIEKSSQDVVFDEVIVAPYTATFGDAFSGVERLRMANEGSAKSNITHFLEKLTGLNIDKSNVQLVN
ncbi:hypothetical protein PTW35_10840 [Photobacterium sp. DA100]|uniref:hypothetical protein n=1 Tax=Photobacterium sp. DA100 TaxID=3027472 RepID=UPI00247A3026|nr:hypothetical protein [Photobacterium sp. DA100]WEM41137.1 hypothetical protein PTW35_10840 [Photobacterium sp. DA100]